MTLAEKGPIQPPPVLAPHLQPASGTIQSWEGVVSATHWDLYQRDRPDGADFYVGEAELGHIHLDGSVHLLTGVPLCRALLDAGLAERFPYGGPASGWVLYRIASEADAAHALRLFRLNYDRLRGVPDVVLIGHVEEWSGEKEAGTRA